MKRRVTFKPGSLKTYVSEGQTILDAALGAGIHINSSCGGQGLCGKCKILIEEGDIVSEPSDKISEEDYKKKVRLACNSRIFSNCTLRIPVESRIPDKILIEKQTLTKGERKIAELETRSFVSIWCFNPPIIKVFLKLDPPTVTDNKNDLSRVLRKLNDLYLIRNVSVDISCLRKMPTVLRESEWNVTITLEKIHIDYDFGISTIESDRIYKIIEIETGNTFEKQYIVAIDIGTTTICGQLLDMFSGRAIAEAAIYNKQMKCCGDDVITRIVFASTPGGKKKLQEEVILSVNEIINELVKKAGISKEHIVYITSAGNTTMTHLLLGLESRYIREAPYVPSACFFPPIKASEVGIDVRENVTIRNFPSVASYVGGDVVAGVLGSGMFQREKLTLFIDIGTNGEIVLGNSEWLVCAACSMGPAFEGGGILHGMRADVGAIEGFRINPITLEPMMITIGKARPRGICGSGLISLLAELLYSSIIDRQGKFVRDLNTKRLRQSDTGYEYVVAWAEHTDIGKDIIITEGDVENLIRAKGALFAGCVTLLESVGFSLEEVDHVFIAGAFGRYLNLEKAKLIGLLPDLPVEKFSFIGNGSLMGARLASFSQDMFREGGRISRMMTNIELSDSPTFMNNYVAALFLPHTEADLFPEVSKKLLESEKITKKERGLGE
ncbi:MAG: ASKHA domain-containing protein [Pseudomonadota bacterium]